MAVCDKHCVQYMVLSKQLPKSVKDKKKCILVILFAKSFTFSSSWYCPINYPNQRRMKNKHLILAILFTHNCTHSLTVCKIITFSRPVKFLYLRFVNKMFQCQIFAELCVIKMDLFNRLDLQSNKKSLQIMNLQYACGCF